MGGSLTKSAYYITYVSEQELNQTCHIDQNIFDPNNPEFERLHPYGAMTGPQIVQTIKQDNRKLITAIDEFKGNEIAKKVTTLYERVYDEINKVMEQKIANKKIGSIYTYLLSSGDTADLAKRYLLDQCFFAETGQRVQNMERVQGILVKIEEKAASKAGWYPQGSKWLNEQDWQDLSQHQRSFNETHMSFLMQSLVFEKMCEGSHD